MVVMEAGSGSGELLPRWSLAATPNVEDVPEARRLWSSKPSLLYELRFAVSMERSGVGEVEATAQAARQSRPFAAASAASSCQSTHA